MGLIRSLNWMEQRKKEIEQKQVYMGLHYNHSFFDLIGINSIPLFMYDKLYDDMTDDIELSLSNRFYKFYR